MGAEPMAFCFLRLWRSPWPFLFPVSFEEAWKEAL
jgi:hypothetical protein